MTRDVWLAKHPYLQPVADVHAAVEAAAAAIGVPAAPIPDWDAYAGEYRAGVPLLHSANLAIDFAPPQAAIHSLIEQLASSGLPGAIAQQCRELSTELDRLEDSPGPAELGSPTGDSFSPSHPGLFHYLSWAVLVRYLAPVVTAFDAWRDEEQWLRSHCPTCGGPPAMAQLVDKDSARMRKLSCGRCRTRWQFQRTGCPFCDGQDDHRLAVLTVEGEAGMRIDYCERCQGYLKTYDGQGNEEVMLADWTSIHLDLLARDRGLKRLAASLYEV